MDPSVDVVVVPDFQGRRAAIQEAQALLLLASWLDYYGDLATSPLHLACIGAPPQTVRRLARQAGARISVHAPVGFHSNHHVGNKLRGLQIEPETGHTLLLDVDTLILSDVGQLARQGHCLAAAPDDWPKLSRTDWRTIYAGVGIDMPAEQVACIGAALDLPRFPRQWQGYKVRGVDPAAMVPYHNGGVLLVPAGCPLRGVWEENIRRIAQLFPRQPSERPWIHRSDQAGLAVSIEMLRLQGWRFRRLPDAWNARWRHLYGGLPPLEEFCVLHLTTFVHRLAAGPLTERGLRTAIGNYLHGKLRRRLVRVLAGDVLRGRIRRGIGRYAAARNNCRRIERYLWQLVERHIRPVFDRRTGGRPVSAPDPRSRSRPAGVHGPGNQGGTQPCESLSSSVPTIRPRGLKKRSGATPSRVTRTSNC